MNKAYFPHISVITPTLNAAEVLEAELESIREQEYPQEKIEIIIVDGGSVDETLNIARKYNSKIFNNPLKTGEAGKAVGIKKSKGELVALIDSDNILPRKDWFRRMIAPFKNPEIVGAEPWKYTYRKIGGFIERYCALIGMNDPVIMFYGNYDKLNILTGKWTEVPLTEIDRGNWIEVILERGKEIPTIGANGSIFRSSFIKKAGISDYLFDIDLLVNEVYKNGKLKFAKVKIGIIHTYCESNVHKFAKKQKRRVSDYYYYKDKGYRSVKWSEGRSKILSLVKFSLYSILVFPAFYHAIKGFIKKPDFAWLFHPLACVITLWCYGTVVISKMFFGINQFNRGGWKQ